jgi:hypothetical protein
MRLQWMVLPALVGALMAATNLAFADGFVPYEGDSVPECAEQPGPQVCRVEESDRCTKYTMVQLQIGLETVIQRECSERTIFKKYFYWQ